MEGTVVPFERNWKLCKACEVLCYTGDPSNPGGCCWGAKEGEGKGPHNFTDTKEYALIFDEPTAPGERDWRRCPKCQELWHAYQGHIGNCPAGQNHDEADYNYILAPGERDWQRCDECEAMCYSHGPCPGGAGVGDHHFPGSQPAQTIRTGDAIQAVPAYYQPLWTGG